MNQYAAINSISPSKTLPLRSFLLYICMLVGFGARGQSLPVLETGSQTPMPQSWIDRDTGHRIIHLISRGGDNKSFYFHNNPFIPARDGHPPLMIFYRHVPGQQGHQLFALNKKSGTIKQLTNQSFVSGEIVGAKKREVYFQCRDSVFCTNVDSGIRRLIYVFPDSLRGGISTLNADESILAGVISSPKERQLFHDHPDKQSYFNLIYNAKLKRSLFTLNIKTGRLKLLFSDHAWLNHLQFSPTDPELLMFCHEGPWHKVDRIWTINIGKGNPVLMHHRTMNMEIAGHEFFSPDGKMIWYDLQKPRSTNFFVGGTNVRTLNEKSYRLTRDEWSVHYTISPDEKLFAGDGGDPGQVARAKDGMWIYLFHPEGDHFRAEKLVNMSHHNYHLEPNVHFSPDGKWVIFRANFEGHSDIYAVELSKKDSQQNNEFLSGRKNCLY